MSDITVRIAQKDGQNTDLVPIGRALLDISANKQAIVAAGGTINSSKDIQPEWESWPAAQKASAESVYSSLAINVYDGQGGTTIVPSGHPDRVKSHVKLKFVFEEEGEMIVSVPHSAALARAPKPLENRQEYIPYLRQTTFDHAKSAFFSALSDDTDLTAGQIAQVMFVYDKIAGAGLRPGENPPKDTETFHTQLGEYNMRQCL